ncbi:hypothetical protein CLAFUW4_10450 [Fulvia fulva]|uniref:Uncharacterized protein n=1 Tax=Passalora fulva TaxID=5499 RepID=A0A9Q8P794_PASFU|nr:uncharacterized protein CLAFUR5_05066 [Fulvia fulva]KAK4616129.1 hypothetical protein CLAFUR4_10454 [Fulvia fulva]KAK4617317.1 hypothetical protein CLAFUR0_10455 [Fulvia fulva]UJO15823.1 hypothetical protein CLAFUR5_05066 [Fulvia fulva]WPV19592.1 hypothetical protein CLAFUW4_10450 [Fulvia fulva]WPV34613.1 hypothetical protein CLAFUW7_10450 [Fulvia fulva]
MKLTYAITTLALATGIVADCPPQQRIDHLKFIVDAFNAKGAASLEGINNLPLAPECDAFLFINGLPGIQPGTFSGDTVKVFAQTVRQVFGYVEGRYSTADNSTGTLDAIVTLGAAQNVLLPIKTRIVVPAEFNPDTCLITELPTYITIPIDIAGNPINPPIIPAIPGLDRLPGLSTIIDMLPPAIRSSLGL